MYGQQNKTASTAGYPSKGVVSAMPPPCEPRTLEQLVGNAVSYVQEINEVRAQAAAIRERLAGGWPEAVGDTSGPAEPGLLGALGQFHGQAWAALHELRSHLTAIQGSLG